MAARGGLAGGDSFGGYRARLVEELRAKGIRDLAVLRAFGEVPRHLFVPDVLTHQAYEDTSLPIGHGQTISQPSTQAVYLEALGLGGRERVLEIGTGSGYQAALLARLAADVVTVERLAGLARLAKQALAAAGARNVLVITGDGTIGWRPLAPYDAVVVAAAGPTVPAPLLDQLADGGRLVAPVSRGATQTLIRLTRRGNTFEQEELGPAQFVPLIGQHGFSGGPTDRTGGQGT
ncbi:MAG TPA: protein-L-isoaspartate(D-aspartate) O-methyltransferase [Gemmatimonadales bacterium]